MTIAADNNNRYSPEFSVPIYFVNVLEGNYSAGHKVLIEVKSLDRIMICFSNDIRFIIL